MNKDPLNKFLEHKRFDTEDIIVAIERSHMKNQVDQSAIDIGDLINESITFSKFYLSFN